jgi:hypothetical protein
VGGPTLYGFGSKEFAPDISGNWVNLYLQDIDELRTCTNLRFDPERIPRNQYLVLTGQFML